MTSKKALELILKQPPGTIVALYGRLGKSTLVSELASRFGKQKCLVCDSHHHYPSAIRNVESLSMISISVLEGHEGQVLKFARESVGYAPLWVIQMQQPPADTEGLVLIELDIAGAK